MNDRIAIRLLNGTDIVINRQVKNVLAHSAH